MNTTDLDLPTEIAETLVTPQAYADFDGLHAAYTWARNNNPLGRAVTRDFDPFWAVTKHADVAAISRDNVLFSNVVRDSILADRETLEMHRRLSGGNPFRTLVQLDDPEHRKLRMLTHAWFQPGNVAKLETKIRAIARDVVERMAARGACEFVTDFASGYPLHVIMEVLGVPPEDEQRMLTLTQEVFGAEDPELRRDKLAALTPEQRASISAAVFGDFGAYFARITEDRRTRPRNDVATILANATIDGHPLDLVTLTSYYIIIATAGHDTTASSTATGMWALCRFPALLPALKADPAKIPAFVEEAIRWQTPVRHFMRTATADTEIRGRKIAKGDWLMLCYGSANRDEEVFERPFEYRIDRDANKQIAFGLGGHTCLGQHLARLEMRVLLEELLPRLDAVEQTGPMTMTVASFVGGPKRLPIRYRMR
ncbi:MAG TPA: cytochrome P450 [Nevskiaceae bacterium]|nr:cytochrome P450 [Nevskiaceae bacterium]